MIEALPARLSSPPPWRKAGSYAVESMTDMGFGESSDFLMCMSGTVRSVFDCSTGEKIARDRSVDYKFDVENLQVDGIGPLSGSRVRMAGIHGGGLAAYTQDG